MDDQEFYSKVNEQLQKFINPIEETFSNIHGPFNKGHRVYREYICANKVTIRRIINFDKGFISPLSCVTFIEAEYMYDNMFMDDHNNFVNPETHKPIHSFQEIIC